MRNCLSLGRRLAHFLCSLLLHYHSLTRDSRELNRGVSSFIRPHQHVPVQVGPKRVRGRGARLRRAVNWLTGQLADWPEALLPLPWGEGNVATRVGEGWLAERSHWQSRFG